MAMNGHMLLMYH